MSCFAASSRTREIAVATPGLPYRLLKRAPILFCVMVDQLGGIWQGLVHREHTSSFQREESGLASAKMPAAAALRVVRCGMEPFGGI